MDSTPHLNNGELLKVLTRLMMPFRREFQQFLDVNRLLGDPEYAREVLDKLLQSNNPSTVGAGIFLRDWMRGDAPVASPASVGFSPQEQPAAPPPSTQTAGVPPAAAPASTGDQGAAVTKYVKRLR